MFRIPYEAQAQPASAGLFKQHCVEERNAAIRPVRSSDGGLLIALLQSLSAHTCLQRYHAARSFTGTAAHVEAARIIAARTARHCALVAAAPGAAGGALLGVAEFARLADDQTTAELGIVVRDDVQRCGIGALLLRGVAAAAAQLGIHTMQIDLQVDNVAMRRLAARFGVITAPPAGAGVSRLLMRLDSPAFSYAPERV
jgi:RimJ/RimL family protein N-acetyltransferase